jgi:hypothetical protein
LPGEAMIEFIDDHKEVHGIEPICKVLPTWVVCRQVASILFLNCSYSKFRRAADPDHEKSPAVPGF